MKQYFYNDYIVNPYDVTDKEKSYTTMLGYMLNRTRRIFRYKNLPDTISERCLELSLQRHGNVGFIEHDNNVYALTGNLGGIPDAYNMPTSYIIVNPYLKLSEEYTINENVIVMGNDSLYIGLIPLLSRYITLMVENEISLNMATIESRIQTLISASDDKSYKSACEYINNILKGKIGVIAENSFLEGINGVKTNGFATSANNTITNLIEYHQYLKASLYNEIGINSNYNMKRESINSAEAQLNNDSLTPLIDDMLSCRKEAIEKINDMYGLNISVDYDSAWYDNEIEHDAMIDKMKNGEIEDNEVSDDEEPDPV